MHVEVNSNTLRLDSALAMRAEPSQTPMFPASPKYAIYFEQGEGCHCWENNRAPHSSALYNVTRFTAPDVWPPLFAEPSRTCLASTLTVSAAHWRSPANSVNPAGGPDVRSSAAHLSSGSTPARFDKKTTVRSAVAAISKATDTTGTKALTAHGAAYASAPFYTASLGRSTLTTAHLQRSPRVAVAQPTVRTKATDLGCSGKFQDYNQKCSRQRFCLWCASTESSTG